MTESQVDTSRTAVRTYVPAYQRAEWDDHADELGMSRSEYVRTMVQAGRRAFGEDEPDLGSEGDEADSEEAEDVADQSPSRTRAGGAGDLEGRIVGVLSTAEYLSWDDLVAEVTDDIEARIESTLQELQSDGRVTYSGRNGGYTLDDE